MRLAQEALTRAQETVSRMLQQARPGGRLAEAASGAALRGPFLAPVELQARRLRLASSDGGGDAPTRPLAEAVAEAFVHLCTTLSCASDLRWAKRC
jgi:hypothetical protein